MRTWRMKALRLLPKKLADESLFQGRPLKIQAGTRHRIYNDLSEGDIAPLLLETEDFVTQISALIGE